MIYRAVIVGCGLAGVTMPQSHAAGYLAHPRTRLVGGVDRSHKALARLGEQAPHGIATSTSLRLLRALRPQLVSIATPEQTHVGVVRSLLKIWRPIGLFIEKPLATSIEGCEEIAERCYEQGIALSVNHARAWDQDVRRMPCPRRIRYGGKPWRNDVHAAHLAIMFFERDKHPRFDLEGPEEESGLWADEEKLWGNLRPNSMVKAISDLIHAIETGGVTRCGPNPATQAVLGALTLQGVR